MFLAGDGMRLPYQMAISNETDGNSNTMKRMMMKRMMMNHTDVYKTDVITGQEQGCCKAGVAETVPDQLCI